MARFVGAVSDKTSLPPVLSVSSVLSGNKGAGGATSDPAEDAETLAAYLRFYGPASYGAAASDLRCGASRAWRAEVALQAAGRITHDRLGRAALTDGTCDEWAERAAIREYDGGLSRADAEREAWRDVLGGGSGA